jgi:hypothetical protein
MYLARIHAGGLTRYCLRQSYFDEQQDCYLFRQIFDFGPEPGDFIDHADDQGPVFVPELVEAVARAGAGHRAINLLETLLQEFFTPEERRQLDRFRRSIPIRNLPFTAADEARLEREIHLIDRKRLYFLRYGAVDQSRLARMHKKLCRPLFGQCRDEREFSFREQEKVLSPAEYRTYVFAIFDLQRFFGESFARWLPEALDQAMMGERLVEEICRLNADGNFWAGMSANSSLHPHLQRYLVMFFDYGYPERSFAQDFARQFADRHRIFRWPENSLSASEKVLALFGKDMEELRRLSKRDLTRLYRQRAKDLHPDSGGDHQRFIELNAVYEGLKKRFGRA